MFIFGVILALVAGILFGLIGPTTKIAYNSGASVGLAIFLRYAVASLEIVIQHWTTVMSKRRPLNMTPPPGISRTIRTQLGLPAEVGAATIFDLHAGARIDPSLVELQVERNG